MAAISTTGTLTAGNSRTFALAPGSALTLTLLPNCRVTVTETPETVSASDAGGNSPRTHNHQLAGVFTYGPYAMGGSVVVDNASNSGSTVTWGRKDTAVTTSSDGTSLVSGDGTYPILQDYFARRAPYGLALTEPPVSGLTAAAGAGVTINSSAAAVVNGETMWTVNATATSGSNNYFELSIATLGLTAAFSAADITAEIVMDDVTKVSLMAMYVGTASYSLSANYPLSSQLTPSTTAAWTMNGVLTAYQFHPSLLNANKSGFTDEVGNQAWINSKLRVYINNGSTLTFSLRAIRVGAYKKKARIAIIGDDGYISFQKMGVPILEEFGFKSSVAVIYDTVGTSDKATLRQLQSYVAKGNECIPHGPNDGTGGTGNLWTTYTTNAQRIADINACRDYLLANNLCTMWGARSYIWPQGRYCESTSDYSMLQVMRDNGYTVGRSANTPSVVYMHKLNALSDDNNALFTTPIVGHIWTSAPTEAANIAAINAKIAATAANGGDCALMLHRVVGVDAAAQSTEISTNRLREICNAIKAEVDAGNMEVVLYSEFAK